MNLSNVLTFKVRCKDFSEFRRELFMQANSKAE